MKKIKNTKNIHELLLFYDKLALELERNDEDIDEEIALQLYLIYDNITDIFRDSMDELIEELAKNPSFLENYSLITLQSIYESSNTEQLYWFVNSWYHWFDDLNEIELNIPSYFELLAIYN